jgi:uncharacterized protein (TIGR02597 family)
MPARQISRSPLAVFLLGGAFAILGSTAIFAQETTTATTGIVGYNTTDCLGSSDTLISVPFHRTPAFSGSVADGSRTTFSGVTDTFTASGTPGWSVGEFEGSHYVKIVTGAGAGLEVDITANTADTLTVDSSGFKGSKINPGDRFLVIPYWTLGTLLPASTQTALHPSTGDLLSQRGSELHFFEPSANGINLSPQTIYYVTAAGWFQAALGSPPADDLILPPHTALVIRHQSGAPDTEFRSAAHVDEDASSILLRARKGASQDNVLAMMRPIPLTLAELDIPPAAFVGSAGTDESKRRDELLVFDNSVAGHNKSEVARYFYDESAKQWRIDDGAAYAAADAAVLPAGAVIVIRKSPASRDAEVVWKNQATY